MLRLIELDITPGLASADDVGDAVWRVTSVAHEAIGLSLSNGRNIVGPRVAHALGSTRCQKSSNSRVSKKAMALNTLPSFIQKYHV